MYEGVLAYQHISTLISIFIKVWGHWRNCTIDDNGHCVKTRHCEDHCDHGGHTLHTDHGTCENSACAGKYPGPYSEGVRLHPRPPTEILKMRSVKIWLKTIKHC